MDVNRKFLRDLKSMNPQPVFGITLQVTRFREYRRDTRTGIPLNQYLIRSIRQYRKYSHRISFITASALISLFIRFHQFNKGFNPGFHLLFGVSSGIVHVTLEDQHRNTLVPHDGFL
jgi:hypothetical protein